MAWIKCCDGKVTIMTDDIKDIVERSNIAHQEMFEAGVNGWPNVLTDAITALTTLSEDNAAMKLEIERLKNDILEIYETGREQAIIIKNLKDTP